ncbi:MAG: Plug and carboxypeptidase regulatory-like domain-containing protein [Acidobacteriota bacterium]|nr:Plug and carboxypeptidase regulatory-like domain-containing protein [Acidobacteriota bacterium]
MRKLINCLIGVLITVFCHLSIQAQTTGSIAGAVADQNGGVVPNATITVKGQGGQEFTVSTGGEGLYNIPAVPNGLYTVTVLAPGFKTLVTTNVKVDIGQPTTVDARLEVGDVKETIEVTGGSEVLQAQTATISTTVTNRQITDTPIPTRNALDLVSMLPGTATVGRPRSASINGLPKSALSITIDGVDVQDNSNRSWDGFFAYVQPRIDAIEEVTVSTAVSGAESSGDGAVQIKFVTKRGTNNYRGGLFWQHRNTALNANYWYNNRDLAPNPETGKAPRNRILLNQYGVNFGGPLPFPNFGEGGPLFDSGKDRAFFFVNYEEFRLPSSINRTRTILTPEAQNGIFSYIVGGQTQTVNLYQIAAANNQLATPDPTIAALLARIRQAINSTGSTTPITNSPNRQFYNFMNSANDVRKFLALRLDFNLTKDHSLEFVANRQKYEPTVDFVRQSDPAFVGFPGYSYSASPKSNTIALRSNFGKNIVNELRYGDSGGAQLFGTLSPNNFASTRGFNLNISSAGGASFPSFITNPYPNNFGYQHWFEPVYELTDSVTWLTGNHIVNFGGQYKYIRSFESAVNWIVPRISFGVDPAEGTAFSMFNAATMPGSTPAQQNDARNLYAVLVGRINYYDTGAYLDESGRFQENAPLTRMLGLKTYGLYAQDQWRIRPGLSVNFGLRWQPQEGFVVKTGNAGRLENLDQVWGISGPGNIFKPGVMTGQAPRVVLYQHGEKIYPDDLNNFAPSLGFVWSPNYKGFLRGLFGESGESVFRAGFSRAFIREGSVQQMTPIRNMPGAGIDVSRAPAFGNFTIGTNLRDPNNPNLTAAQFSVDPNFPMTLGLFTPAVVVDSNIKTGYVDSFSVGYQRQLDRDSVIEIRYVGNRGHRIRRTRFINEINTIENGFANEFQLAQANLYANIAAGRGASFAYFGSGTGTFPLPIMLAYFNAPANYDPNNPARYVAANFTNAALVTLLSRNAPNVIGFVGSGAFENNAARRANAIANSLPANFFRVNPAVNMANILSDDASTWYDSAVIEFRRRLSEGLRVQASYVFSKAQSNAFASSENQRSDYTLREGGLQLAKNAQVFDIRHAFKFDATYELPFGKGRTFFSDAGTVSNAFIGGWSITPVVRWQSGSPFNLGNVQLVGMTKKELQDEIKVRKGTNVVTYLPDNIILNTQRAFDISVISPTGYGTTFGGAPQGRFIAPAGYGNCIQRFAGECGFTNLILYGPDFFKFDVAVSKKIFIDEKRNIEFRAAFLDAFNQPSFRIGGWISDVTGVGVGGATFGQLGPGSAYQDLSGTNNPGGRIIDFILRINF